MAYTPGTLGLQAHANGFAQYRYDTLDASTAVDADGYFNNDDDDLKLVVGDLIWVTVWTTAVRTGTIADVALHVVSFISAAGSVNLSDDLLGATVTSSD